MTKIENAIAEGRTALGLWQTFASPYTAEICANAGFDWLLFDGEHAPNTIQTLLAQVQAVAAYDVEAVARLPARDPVLIKQYLDIGITTLLAPMVDDAEQAEGLLAATRFPPAGSRGVAGSVTRASRFGAVRDYLKTAHESIRVHVQIESAAGLANIDEIAAVDGVAGLFIGPGDLSASLGHLGEPRRAEVQDAIARALQAIRAANKIAGVYALDVQDAREKIEAGFQMVSIGADAGLLSAGARDLLANVGR